MFELSHSWSYILPCPSDLLGIMEVWGFQPKNITQNQLYTYPFQQFGSIG